MPTNSEKYNHTTMSNDDLEERIAADLLELSKRLETETAVIAGLLYRFMHQIREAYRTARLVTEGR